MCDATTESTGYNVHLLFAQLLICWARHHESDVRERPKERDGATAGRIEVQYIYIG